MASVVGPSKQGSSSSSNTCKIIVQQCTKAELGFDTNAPPVSIKRGIVVYVCFLQGATENSVETIAKTILETRLCEPLENQNQKSENGSHSSARRVSPLEFAHPNDTSLEASRDDPDVTNSRHRFDILIVPQATLTGKLKGKSMQYHGLIDKAEGFLLFSKLVETIRQQLQEKNPDSVVHHGIYGARQILSMETNGPFTHVFDF